MEIKAGSIVVGVDGSEASARAVLWAADQAGREKRSLTLVHGIYAVTPAYYDATVLDPREARAQLLAVGQKLLTDVRETVEAEAPGVEVEEVLRLDDPRIVLLEASRHASMLVLGSRGLGTLRRLMLGSVSVAVARNAGCPVVVHRPSKPGAVHEGILVGADGSAESRVVLDFAYQQASLREVPLTVLHSFWDLGVTTIGGYALPDESIDPEGERRLLAESMAGLGEKYPDVAVTAETARGRAADVIVRVGDTRELIVVGAHQESLASQLLFGSVSVAVLEHASTPVAVVPLSTH